MNLYVTIAQFFGYEEDTRPIEGFLSWQHLVFVSCFVLVAFSLAIILGIRNKNKDEKKKNRVLGWATILIWLFEGAKYVVVCTRNHDPKSMLSMLPLFLCSMQLIALPLAWLAKGTIKRAACNFVFIFGILGALTGTYLAGNYFGGNPIFCFSVIDSVITHCISGFAGLYLAISGMAKIDKSSIAIDAVILLMFELFALTANSFLEPTPYESNYMFLSRSAGTPFEICNTLVGGVQYLYTIFVASLYFIYMILFVLVWALFSKKEKKS